MTIGLAAIADADNDTVRETVEARLHEQHLQFGVRLGGHEVVTHFCGDTVACIEYNATEATAGVIDNGSESRERWGVCSGEVSLGNGDESKAVVCDHVFGGYG